MKLIIEIDGDYSFCGNCKYLDRLRLRCNLFGTVIKYTKGDKLYRLPQCIKAQLEKPKPQTQLYANHIHCLGRNCEESENCGREGSINESCLFSEIVQYDPETDALGAYQTIEEYRESIAMKA